MLLNCYCCYCLTTSRLRYVVITSCRGTDEDDTTVSCGGVTFVPLCVKTGSEVVNGQTHSYKPHGHLGDLMSLFFTFRRREVSK